ncbi:MAG: hypothetical protein NTV86_07225 [Planctomycetota bacterium]|nr:hypothetical protein [Planctomycetota bacterium]
MNRRDRLLATLRGEPVDRPAVNFYEVGGFAVDPGDPDPFNVYNDPSWRPLLQLAEEKTDLLRMRGVPCKGGLEDPCREFWTHEARTEGLSRFHRSTLRIGGRTMTSATRVDAGVSTTWTLEHLLKTPADVEAYLQLPDPPVGEPDVGPILDVEKELGDRGLVLLDTGDPLCEAAGLFSMEDYTTLAMTEPELFHRLLERSAARLHPWTEKAAAALPGRLWRIVGSEYASEPYLPPHLYAEYEVRYTRPMAQAIRRHGGFVRLHSHGRLRNILPHMAAIGIDATDPVEPPPQGDMDLIDVRREYGREWVLFGNIEASDIEMLPADQFEQKVARALREGTAGPGRGFVLAPSASPYGRTITPRTLANYETMIRLAENFGG